MKKMTANTNTWFVQTEKLDIELSHAELRSLFQQLNTIQAELDASETPSVT